MAEWVRLQTVHSRALDETTDIQNDLNIWGDDMHEFINAYAERFKVDMSAYRWYFHLKKEEGWGIGKYFVRPPYWQVKQIPVTVAMMTRFANSGAWTLDYPPHRFPKRRYDMWIDTVVAVVMVLGLVMAVVWKYSG